MVRVFISYAHADESLRQELDKHLASLKHQGVIETWHDRRIAPGDEWASAIDQNLESADVVLLLVSADFIASEYCYDKEMREAMMRHDDGKAVVVPVILRPCEWHGLPFGKLQAATRNGRPIVKFTSLDDGFLEVVQSIKKIAKQCRARSTATGTGAHETEQSPKVIAAARPRSGNLSVKKTFSDQDRDEFRGTAMEYVGQFFENSLAELEQRNAELSGQFRRRDANSFEATAYKHGKQVAKCGIWLSGENDFGEIRYSSSGLGGGNSFNESLNVADDGQVLGLNPMGFGRLTGGTDSNLLTLEGAAEYLWSIFIDPLQR